MKGKMSTQMGNIVIDRDVLAKYAGTATMECYSAGWRGKTFEG